MSFTVTNNNSKIRNAMPAAWIYPSILGFTFLRVTASTKRKKSLPPSSPGIGSTLKKAKEIERSPMRFNNCIALSVGLGIWIIEPTTYPMPTGPETT